MSAYLIKRLAALVLNLFLVTIFVFVMLRAVPGDAAAAILGSEARPENVQKFKEEHGLTGSFTSQYLDWFSGILQGDFGKSLRGNTNVTDNFISRFPVTLEIVILSFGFTVLFGVTSGIFSALKQNSWMDVGVRFIATLGIAIPNFLLLTLLLLIPARLWGYAPPFGATNLFDSPLENLRLFLPPTILLAIGSSAVLMRFTRSGFLEVMRQDYIRTARSKGLRERVILSKHALKNAMLPVVTLFGLQLGFILGGTVVLESIFALPGLGTLLLDSVIRKDFTQLQGLVLFFSVVIIIINIAVDLSYAWFDPRIRFS